MSTLIVIVVVAAILWVLGFWPFNRSYAQLPTFNQVRAKNTEPPVDNKPVP